MTANAAVVIGVLIAVSLAGLVLERVQVGTLTTTIEPALTANRQVLQAMTDAQSAVRGYELDARPGFVQQYRAAQPALTDALATLDRLGARAGIETGAREQRSAVQNWQRQVADPSLGQPSRRVDQDTAAATFARFRQANTALSAALQARSASLNRQSGLLGLIVMAVVVCTGLAGMVMIIGRGRRAQRTISPPLEDLQQVVSARAAGDLDVRADPDVGVVEVREVAAAVNELMLASAQARQRLADDVRLGRATREIGLSISHNLDMRDIMNTSATQLRSRLGADLAWVRTFEGENDRPGRVLGTLQPSSIALVSPPHLQKLGVEMAPKLWQAQLAANLSSARPGVPGILAEVDGRALVDFVTEGAGVTALLLVPLGVGTQCLGYFALGRFESVPGWSEAEARAALEVGHYLGRAVLHERMFDGERQVIEKLQALDRQKTEFVSTVSHELRTPLAAIIGHLELIDEEEVSGTARRSLHAVERNSQRLRLLIEDLLLLSRVESRESGSVFTRVDLHAVAERAVASRPPGAAVGVDLSGAPEAIVLGDEDELARMVDNLISNAVKFSPAGSRVQVSVDQAPGTVILRVRDHGIGIAAADQPHVFTRFFRSSRLEAHSVPGTGLGLTITKIIADKHEARVEVDSELGQGTTMTVVFSLAEPRHRGRVGTDATVPAG